MQIILNDKAINPTHSRQPNQINVRISLTSNEIAIKKVDNQEWLIISLADLRRVMRLTEEATS